MGRKRKYSWMVLLFIAAGIRVLSLFPATVEQYYSTGVYPVIARLLRLLFGWVPFSVGDVFYVACGIALLYQIFCFFKKLFKKQADRNYFFLVCRRIFSWVLLVYIFFNVLWGLNYNRQGIAHQMQLNVQPYSNADLAAVLELIVNKLNTFDSAAVQQRTALNSSKTIFARAQQAYVNLNRERKIFAYPSPSVKPSLFGYLGDYLGFTGYYNPFSGEAQVNTTVPVYVQPFTTCHEIGHQLGYAKEDEANVAGYLSGRSSPDPAFQYSVYFDLYFYAAGELYGRDSTLMVPLRERLKPAVRKDFRDLQKFYLSYRNPLEPLIRKLYGNYLKANQQPQGIMRYNEVIAWLIAYYKKYGAIAV